MTQDEQFCGLTARPLSCHIGLIESIFNTASARFQKDRPLAGNLGDVVVLVLVTPLVVTRDAYYVV